MGGIVTLINITMQYNSHANNLDCVSEILKICKATTGKYPLNDITRRFNFALDRYCHLAFEANGSWSFDDINNSNPPIDTQNIVSGTNKYKIGSFTEKIFMLLALEVLDTNSKSSPLILESFDDLRRQGISFTDAYSTSVTGVPTHVLKLGDFIYLRPTPNFNMTAGLKAFFNRPANYMATSDTTKVPGVPGIHHEYLCLVSALPYLEENTMSNMVSTANKIAVWEEKIKNYFVAKEKPKSRGMQAFKENNK